MKEPRPFFGRIESLRGIGALAVAGYHITGWTLNGYQLLPYEPWPTAGAVENAIGRALIWLFPGHAALMMFFAISGFVLHVSLQYGPQEFAPAAKRFLVARAFRIYPIVVVGVLLVGWVAGWQPIDAVHRTGQPLTVGEIVAHMLLLDARLNTTLWALQVEVLMAPIILALFFVERSYGTRVLLAVGLVTTALSFAKSWAIWPPLSNNMFAFVLGMLIPTLGRQWANGLTRQAAHAWLWGAVFVMFAAGPVFGFFSRFAAVFETYAALALLSIVAYRTDIRGLGFLDHWTVRQLGLSSGSYYVLHVPLLLLALSIMAMIVPAAWSAQAPALTNFVVIVVMLVAIAPIAFLSFRLVEAPGMWLGRRIFQRRRAAPAE